MRSAIFLLSLFLLASCASAPPVQAPPPNLAPQIAALKTRLFVLVEETRLRALQTRKPLVLDPPLVAAAQAHADDMAKNLSFVGRDAESNAAVQSLVNDPNFQGYVGETSAAQFFTPQIGIEPESFARGFIDLWMKNESHRETLLFGGFNRIGIGVTANGSAVYVSALFVSDLAQSADAAPSPSAPP